LRQCLDARPQRTCQKEDCQLEWCRQRNDEKGMLNFFREARRRGVAGSTLGEDAANNILDGACLVHREALEECYRDNPYTPPAPQPTSPPASPPPRSAECPPEQPATPTAGSCSGAYQQPMECRDGQWVVCIDNRTWTFDSYEKQCQDPGQRWLKRALTPATTPTPATPNGCPPPARTASAPPQPQPGKVFNPAPSAVFPANRPASEEVAVGTPDQPAPHSKPQTDVPSDEVAIGSLDQPVPARKPPIGAASAPPHPREPPHSQAPANPQDGPVLPPIIDIWPGGNNAPHVNVYDPPAPEGPSQPHVNIYDPPAHTPSVPAAPHIDPTPSHKPPDGGVTWSRNSGTGPAPGPGKTATTPTSPVQPIKSLDQNNVPKTTPPPLPPLQVKPTANAGKTDQKVATLPPQVQPSQPVTPSGSHTGPLPPPTSPGVATLPPPTLPPPTLPGVATLPPATLPPPMVEASCSQSSISFNIEESQNVTQHKTITGGASCVHHYRSSSTATLTSLTIVRHPNHGTLSQTGDLEAKYTPNVGFKGSDSYVVKLCGHGRKSGCSLLTYEVSVDQASVGPASKLDDSDLLPPLDLPSGASKRERPKTVKRPPPKVAKHAPPRRGGGGRGYSGGGYSGGGYSQPQVDWEGVGRAIGEALRSGGGGGGHGH
jgi:hypothetical protein